MTVSRRSFLKRACSIGSIGLAASYPIVFERFFVQTNVYRIPVPNLPKGFNGFRIVHLSDLHYGAFTPAQLFHSVLDRAMALKPDAIVCTGDNVHGSGSAADVDGVWHLLSKLAAPSGVFSVLGNHDHWADASRSIQWLKKSGQDLRHKAVRLHRGPESLWLAGAGDFFEDHRNLDEVLDQIPDRDCRILLAHNPDTADTFYSKRVDLVMSGHTHGGQVQIPFIGPLFVPVRNKEYTHGLRRSPRGCRVFISRGIGYAVCPVRFNCYPEIAVLELVPEAALPA